MRSFFAVVLAALTVSYGVVAVYLFEQEQWSREPPSAPRPASLRHPEALLALLQQRFDAGRTREEELALVRSVLAEVPTFYQPPFLLATFHAQRMEKPDKVREAFEAALSRYPANGRLHLAYGTWLLDARASLDGWRIASQPGALRDPLPDAERQLRSAIALEPELAWSALRALARNRVPSARWAAVVSDDPLARTHLLDALFQAGELEQVWERLQGGALRTDDVNTLRRIVSWGLEGQRPEIALEAAERWKAVVERTRRDGPELLDPSLAVARAYIALGEPQRAYDSLASTLERVESRFGTSSRLTLQFLCAMGDEYLARSHVATAEALYAQALARSASYVPAILGLARSSRSSGDVDGAIVRYEEALRIEPRNDAARRELRALLANLTGSRR